MISISVVIPTRNGAKRLESVLSRIVVQRSPYPFEIIAVDSGSTDKTVEICEGYSVKVIQIPPENFNHGRTRNYGIAHAKGDFAILLSQDASPYDENWMPNLIENLMADDSAAGAYSRQIPYEDAPVLIKKEVNSHLTGRLERSVRFLKGKVEYERMTPRERALFCNFDNVSSCIRKSVWDKIPFPEADFAEDLEWAERALRSGYKIVYESRSIVFHSHSYNLIDEYRRTELHHKKVFELFGFKPIPEPWKILPFSMMLILRDVHYLMTKSGVSLFKKFEEILKLPIRIFMRTLAQYMGGRLDEDTSNSP